VAQALVDGIARWPERKPVLTVFMSARGVPELLRRSELRIPCYAFPESAARALAHAVRYGQWRSRPAEPPAKPAEARRDEALALVATAVERGAGWLLPAEVEGLLRCYGIPLVAQRFAPTPEEAGVAGVRRFLLRPPARTRGLPGGRSRADRTGERHRARVRL
jgi:acyl-CoA synthetase (NDP forming)